MASWILVLIVVVSTIMLGVAVYLLSIFNRLFIGVRNKWLRKNLAVLVVGLCFMFSLLSASSEIFMKAAVQGWVKALAIQMLQSTLIVLFVFNVVWAVMQIPAVKKLSFFRHHTVVVLTIVLA
ncbi:MAG: hypothetical protein JNL59_00150, partial [Chitinophagaceae bacterium]|nr:hypothetical protein [Chitinophagaceae bacterium]